jgi:hypothetical protein
MYELLPMRQMGKKQELLVVAWVELEYAGVASDDDGSAVGASGHVPNVGNRMDCL